MTVYYLNDPPLQREKNARGENHWAAYLPEMLQRLGVAGRAWIPGEAADFREGDALLAGADALAADTAARLAEGVRRGLTLIGFATRGADDLFGIQYKGSVPQPGDEFSLSGYFTMGNGAQRAYMNVPEQSPELPVFSPLAVVSKAGAETLGTVTACAGADNATMAAESATGVKAAGAAGAVANAEAADIAAGAAGDCAANAAGGARYPGFLRCGNAFYFAFDLPQTLWAAAQGRPVTEDAEGFTVGRLPMARITPFGYNTEIAYGDYYLYILQNILADLGCPMLHCLPAADGGEIPDLMLYYAGDEDAVDPAVSIDAADIMAKRGLPYHINLMPYGADMDFRLSQEQFDALREGNCELDLHYNMVDPYDWCVFSEENFRRQYRAFLRRFGVPSVSTVGHCLAHNGWVDRMRFLEGLGIKGDFERTGEYDPDDINAFGMYGFAFGVSFPFFPYDGAPHGNRRINALEAPLAYYEPRIGDKYPDGAQKIRRCIDAAAYFSRMINLFTHPHYVSGKFGYDNAMTLAALDEAVRYAAQKGYRVLHSSPDRVCEFWRARSQSSVRVIHGAGGAGGAGGASGTGGAGGASGADGAGCAGRWAVDCACGGLAVRIPAECVPAAARLSIDGKPAAPARKTADGREWLMLAMPGAGGHIIEATLL